MRKPNTNNGAAGCQGRLTCGCRKLYAHDRRNMLSENPPLPPPTPTTCRRQHSLVIPLTGRFTDPAHNGSSTHGDPSKAESSPKRSNIAARGRQRVSGEGVTRKTMGCAYSGFARPLYDDGASEAKAPPAITCSNSNDGGPPLLSFRAGQDHDPPPPQPEEALERLAPYLPRTPERAAKAWIATRRCPRRRFRRRGDRRRSPRN